MSHRDQRRARRHRELAPWLDVPVQIAKAIDYVSAQARKDEAKRDARTPALTTK